jgi:hypothetical protein
MNNWDFSSILVDLRNYLSQKNSWSKIFFYSTIDNILKTIAWSMSQLKYLADTYMRESNWGTAQLLKSLSRLSVLINYTIKRPQGATGTVIVSASPTFSPSYVYTGNKVIIPRWTQFTNANKDSFVYCSADTTYDYNQTGSVDIPVIEGTPKTYTYIAQGINDETISVYSNAIENNLIEVFIVDALDVVLSTVNICNQGTNPKNLYLVENDLVNYYCEIKTADDFQKIDIKFGDDVTARKLLPNQRVMVKYAETKGTTGNITGSNIITASVLPITDISSAVVTLYFNNTASIAGGVDVEELEHVRNTANNLFFSGYRAGGESDWNTQLANNTLINKAIISVDAAYPNTVFVSAVSSTGAALTTDQQTSVINTFKDLKSPTEVMQFLPLKIIYLLFKAKIEIDNTPVSVVSGQVFTVLDAKYGILNTPFQTDVYESNYICDIKDGVTAINHHTTQLWHLEKNNEQSFPSTLSLHIITPSVRAIDDADPVNQILIVPGTTELWYAAANSGIATSSYQRIAYDVGSGVLVGENGYIVSSSSISFVNNTISYNISNIAGTPYYNYNLFIAYKTKDGNGDEINSVRLPSASMITDIEPEYQQFTITYA